jgi:nitrile hydratase accessory protein
MKVTDDLPVELDLDGPFSPPRSNGELGFAEPWESRVFGVAIALRQEGVFAWDDFRDQLISSIARWEVEHPDGADYRYYVCWLEALQVLLRDHRIVSTDDLAHREGQLALRPAGHDHDDQHQPH